MHQEQHLEQTNLPTLICPKYHAPIVFVCEDEKDIMNSRLLCSRSLCNEFKDLSTSSKDELKCVEDILRQALLSKQFIREVINPSPILNASDVTSSELLKQFNTSLKDWEGRVKEDEKVLKHVKQQMKDLVTHKCDELGVAITSGASVDHQRHQIQLYQTRLQQVVQSDPSGAANFPTPTETLQKVVEYFQCICFQIEELKASEQLPEYLFGIIKHQRAWKAHASNQLLHWKLYQERFYAEHLEQALKQSTKNERAETALLFFQNQVQKLSQQVQQIVEEDESDQKNLHLDLFVQSPETLDLITNSMITRETRLVYQLVNKDINLEEGKQVHRVLERLTNVINIQIDLAPFGKNNAGLVELSRGLLTMKQLRSIFINCSGGNLSFDHIKGFFGPLSQVTDAFFDLNEIILNFSETPITKEGVALIFKGIKALASDSVKSLTIHFSGCSLTSEFGTSLGDALKSFKGLRSLIVDGSGYSLKQNDIKDKGFTSIVQALDSFSETLMTLDLNFGQNGLTDQSLVAFHHVLHTAKWPKLKNLNLSLYKNGITEKGLRKLSKSLNLLSILLRLNLNISQNEVDLQSVKFMLQSVPPFLLDMKINLRGCSLNEEELHNYLQSQGLQEKVLV